MTKNEIIDGLRDLIRDREVFTDGNDIFQHDIDVLQAAIEKISELPDWEVNRQ